MTKPSRENRQSSRGGDQDAPRRLLTVEDVCAMLGVSKDYVYDQVAEGRLRASMIARQLRFRPSAVEDFIDQNAVSGAEL